MICTACKQEKETLPVNGNMDMCQECFSVHMGCPFVVSSHSEIVKGKTYKHNEYCRRIASRTSLLCPKHELIVSEEDNEKARRSESRKRKKEMKINLAAMLESSPLRAENPQFPQKNPQTGYEA